MAGLVDQFGRPIDFGRLKERKAAADTMGVRSPFAGHPADGLTPQRLAGILRGAESGDPVRYLELAEQMEEKYLHYLSVLGTRKRAVQQLDITVEAATTDAADVKVADFVREWVERDELEFEIFDILDAIGKGFSVTEIVWDLSGNTWMPERLVWVDPRWIDFDRADMRTPLLRTSEGPQPLDPYGYIVHEHKAKSGLAIRGGLARPVAWAYLFQNYSVKDWVAFAEVYGLPLRVGKYDSGETDANIRTLMNALAGISSDAAAVIPKSMEIEFIAGDKGGSTDLFDKLCAYLDRQVSKAVIGQTATTDADTGGLGSGKEHGDVRTDIRDADAKLLASTLKRDLIAPMVALNFGPDVKVPGLKIGVVEGWDAEAMMPVVQTFVSMGGKVGMAELRDKIGFADPGPEEELLTAPAVVSAPAESPGSAPDGGAPAPVQRTPPAKAPERPLRALKGDVEGGGSAAASAMGVDQSDAIDDLVEDMLGGWQPVGEHIAASIEEVFAECASLEEARARMSEVLARLDTTPITTGLAFASFNARLAGAAGQGLEDNQELEDR